MSASIDNRPRAVKLLDELEAQGKLKEFIELKIIHPRLKRAVKIWKLIDIQTRVYKEERMVAIQHVMEVEGLRAEKSVYNFLNMLQ